MVIDVDGLVLVRHAMPEQVPEVRSERWQLGDAGRASARSLRSSIPETAYLVASDEPKAIQTLQELGDRREVAIDAGFGEVRRPYVWLDGYDYRSTARAYVEGVCHDGWEPHAQVAERFAQAVARHAGVAAATGRTLVIGTHGLAPTVWLTGVVQLLPSPGQFWEDLRFPDVIDVDLAAGTASRRIK